MPHVFGRSLEFSFTPIIDNEPVEVDSLVSARLYSAEPSDAEVENPADTGTGFVDGATEWKSKGLEKIITFAAVTDPSPHSTSDYERYWVAVNFLYEEGGDTVFLKEPIYIYRPDAVTSKIETRFDDVFRVEPKLKDHYGIADINDFIKEAKDDIYSWFQGLKVPLSKLGKLEQLNRACKYRAAMKACFALYSSQAPEWRDKALEHRTSYYDALNTAQPTAGEDGGTPEQPARTTGMVIMLR